MSDVNFVYPVTPTAYVGEQVVAWHHHRYNDQFFGKEKIVKVLQTRCGAGAVIHGAITTGSVVSSYLPSSGLLAMLPNLPKIVSAKRPTVMHVSCRDVSDKLAVSSDYSAIQSASLSGAAVLLSDNQQEAHDVAVIAQMAALRSSSTFLHGFDGARVATEKRKINLLSSSELESLIKTHVPAHRTGHTAPLPTSSLPALVDLIMDELKEKFHRRYRPFEYIGDNRADNIIITMGANTSIVEDFVKTCKQRVGILKVKLYRPWSIDHFLQVLPKSVKKIAVLEQVKNASLGWGPLYRDVVTTIQNFTQQSRPLVVSGVITSDLSLSSIQSVFANLSLDTPKDSFTVSGVAPSEADSATSLPSVDSLPGHFAQCQQVSIWDLDSAVGDTVPHNSLSLVTDPLARVGGLSVNVHTKYDTNCVHGVLHTVLRFGFETSAVALDTHDAVVCHSPRFLSEYDMLHSIKQGGSFILNCDFAQTEKTIPASVKRDVCRKKLRFYTIDVAAIATELSDTLNDRQTSHVAMAAVFYQLCYGTLDPLVTYLKQNSHQYIDVPRVALAQLRSTEVPPEWLDAQDDVEQPLSTSVEGSLLPLSAYSLPHNKFSSTHTHPHFLSDETKMAWYLAFPGVFKTEKKLRLVGGSHADTHRVKLTKFVKLTPSDYDRNIFHMEMDITGTSLKYDMGEALAVYGLNPVEDVLSFLSFYGLDPNSPVCINYEKDKYTVRTVLQVFQQYLDIFGRPSKKFYQTLAEFATDPKEREQLLHVISEEGKDLFKNRVTETTTFNDLLREFTSAKPSLTQLLDIIPPIKPRHYSIASSMKMHPNSVHLLVVVDDWTTPSGKYRVGQCSGYLATLTNPEKSDIYLTVSVAPSLMKLPPKHTQPVIMAGLGTGMAPFRAFIQERQYFAAQGEDVGPMALYFGSRFRAKEYLYGEELEAYNASGLLTYLRLAFSRDQKDKVYIQHKLQKDKSEIHDLLMKENGHFYLCGPTWPAGDVYDAIVDNFCSAGGLDKAEAQKEVYNMKEEGRYVLEVY